MAKTVAKEEENSKLASVLADKSMTLKSEVRAKVTTVRKFLGNARDGVASVRKGLTDIALDIEKLIVTLSPLEDSITALELAQHQHSLKVCTQRQELILQAEAQRHQ